MMGLNKKAYAYGKKLIREGHLNVGGDSPGPSDEMHYLGDGSFAFIGRLLEQDTVFKSALLQVVTDAAEDQEIVEAAEDLIERIEKAEVAAEGSDLTGAGTDDGGGGKPPPDQGTSADLSGAEKREWVGSNLHRSVSFDRAGIDEEARTVEVAFSSTAPYERFFGMEILGHGDGEMDLSRVNNAAAVLVDHNTSDQVGVIEKAWVDGDKGRALLRFSKSVRGDEIFTDIADGIRQLVSVGYFVESVKEIEAASDDGPATFYVDRWQPFEVSVVAVPADTSVGVGRNRSQESQGSDELGAKGEGDTETAEVETKTLEEKEVEMTDEEKKALEKAEAEAKAKDAAKAKDREAKLRAEGQSAERERVKNLTEYAEVHKDLSAELLQKHIASGDDVMSLSRAYVAEKKGRQVEADKTAVPDEDASKFSLLKVARYLAQPTRENEKAAGYELEMCRAEAQGRGGDINGIAIPGNIWKRDLTVGTDSAGGYLKPTDHGPLIELLRPKSHMLQLATIIPGLVGDVSFPTQSGGATAYWVAEGGDVTESNQTFGTVTLAPKTVGTFTDMSRKTLLQTVPAIESVVRNDLLTTLAVEIDRVALEGSGSGAEPTGVINTTGIGDVSTGTNGEALTWTDCVNIWKEIAVDNADTGSMAWVTSPSVVAHMMTKPKAADTDSNFILNDLNDGLLGFPVRSTTQSPDDLTQGSGTALSALTLGVWSDLLIGTWGGLTLNVDDTTLGTQGARRIIVLQDIDIAVRHAESFSGTDDIDTTA